MKHAKKIEQLQIECLNQLFDCFDPGSCKRKVEEVFSDYMESEAIVNVEGKDRANKASVFMKLNSFFAACEQISRIKDESSDQEKGEI